MGTFYYDTLFEIITQLLNKKKIITICKYFSTPKILKNW